MLTRDTDIRRFMSKIPERPDGRCWLWQSYKDTCGYGKFKINGKHHMAHRLSYSHFMGPIPDWATVIRHCCDNPSCVNPAHLLPGTQKDNVADREMRGRGASHVGELNGRVVISKEHIPIIRARIAAGERLRVVADEFCVTKQNIWRIVHRRTWAHV